MAITAGPRRRIVRCGMVRVQEADVLPDTVSSAGLVANMNPMWRIGEIS